MTGGQPPDEASAEPRAGDPVPLSEAVVTSAVVWKLVMPAPDGLALAGADGGLVFVNRRMEEIFGYDRAELLGSPVEKLIPAELRAAHRGHRDDYARAPRTRPMGAGLRLLGLRKDGATFPVEISLSPLATVEGPLTVAVVRDVTVTRGMEDLAKAAAAAASREGVAYELHDMVASGLFRVWLSLQAAADLPANAVMRRVLDAVDQLDDMIRQARTMIAAQTRGSSPP